MNLAKRILAIAGWTVKITVPDYPKCIICVAPHTSNWDFILGKLAYWSVNRKAGFLMKETWFFPPLGWIFKAIGGIPVPRKRGSSLTPVIVEKFRNAEYMHLAVTPEGTRSRVSEWRRGFLYIAREANVPIVLGIIDASTKTMTVDTTFHSVGDIDQDMQAIKKYYRASGALGLKPEKFTTD